MTRSSFIAFASALLVSLALALPAYSATPGAVLTVESVLSPAWVERVNGRREPLTVGMALSNKEKVHTGDGGRAMLRLAEGSAVKLGEGAMMSVDELVQKPDAKTGGLVSASVDVVRGAFRFTTGLLAKPQGSRDVRIRVNALTAGIRGTDVWGKSEADRDVVCLLEGRISVSHGSAQFLMQEANTFYIAPRVGQAQPPSSVSPEQVREWSAETEIEAQTGATRRGGTASVVAAVATNQESAMQLQAKLRESGFPASVAQAGARHEVRIDALASAGDAAVLAKRLQSLGFNEARAM